MTKLATLPALFAALLVMFHVASAVHRTIVTTVEVDEDSFSSEDDNQWLHGSEGWSCHDQILRQAQGLFQCEQLFEEASRGKRGGRHGIGGSMREKRSFEHSEHFRPCCQELRKLDDQCRCEGIREIVGELQGESRRLQEQLLRSARNLPSMCGISPQRCEIRAMWY